MASGVCSVMKTRPRRVRRSVSDASINVQGAVVMKKVWMFEDGQLNSGEDGHADKLSVVDVPLDVLAASRGCRHHWFLTTNLASAQNCAECNRRIRMRQAAYKCTDCKRVAHLKCAAVTTEEKRGRKPNDCTPNRTRELFHSQNVTHRNRVRPINVKIERQPVTPPGVDRQPLHQIDNVPDCTTISQTNSLDSLADMYAQDGKMNSSSRTAGGTTIQSRCRQTLDCVKQTFKKRCRSFRRKSKSSRDKRPQDEEMTASSDGLQQEVTVDNDETEVKIPLGDGARSDAHTAWVRSPIRSRLRSRQGEMAEGQSQYRDQGKHPRRRIRVPAHKRPVRRPRYQANNFDLELLKDRLVNVEHKVRELETVIPQEVAEWRRLNLKFQDDGGSILSMTVKATDNLSSETSKQPEITLSQDQPSSSMSDEVFVVPEGSSSSNGDHGAHDLGLCENYDSLTTMPSAIPNGLRYAQASEKFDHHTSTPVTNREISFRSASKNYELAQVTHTNVTRISIGNTASENQVTKRLSDVDICGKRKSAEFETSSLPEKSVLSPNQLAVKSFLQKRKRLSSPLSGNAMLNQSGSLGSQSVNQSDLCNSPPVASSTLRNGDKTNDFCINSDISPLSFTIRNDLENSRLSHAKLFMEGSRVGKNDFDRQCSNASALSYTLRNDSSMMPMDEHEDLPAFSRNDPMVYDHHPTTTERSLIRNTSEHQCYRSTSVRFENIHDVDGPQDINTVDDHEYCRSSSVRFEDMEPETDHTGDVETDGGHTEQADVEAAPVMGNVATKCNTTLTTTTTDGLSLTNITEFTGEFLDSLRDFETNLGATASAHTSRDANPTSAMSYESSSISQDSRKSDSFLREVKEEIDAHFNKLHNDVFGYAESDGELKEKHDGRIGEKRDFSHNFMWALGAWRDRESKPVDERGDGKPPVPVMKEKSSQFTNIGRKLKELFSHSERAQLCKKTEENVVVQKQEDGICLQKLDRKLNKVFNFADYPDFEDDVLDKSSVKDMDVQESESAVAIEGAGELIVESSSVSTNKPKHTEDIHISSLPNSTHEFEVMEKHFQDESLRNRVSGHQVQECMAHQQRLEHGMFGKAKSCSTGSIDGINHDYSKYHFLHDKGMIKISSPSLKLVSESPMEKRNFCLESSDIDEATDIAESSSDLGGLTIDDQFQSDFARKSGKGSLCSGLTEIQSSISSPHVAGTSKDPPPPELCEHQMFEQCLRIVDENQQKWNDVISWMNQECGHENLGELEDELGLLVARSGDEKDETEQTDSNSPVDDSVYYSFRGQSDELRNIFSASPFRTDINTGRPGCLMDAIVNGSIDDVENLLSSDTTISESEIKEAVHWSIQQRSRPITMLLLNDICQLLVGSEGEDVVEAWPAYRDHDPWTPVFVVLGTNDCQAHGDQFMDFDVYRRRYDSVSPEAANVMNNKLVRNNPLSLDVFEAVTKVIDSAKLHEKHKKLTLINACPCRSKDGGTTVESRLCIVVHCLVKGLIPFDEEPFPTRINDLPVDVREGYFSLGMETLPAAQTWLGQQGHVQLSRDPGAASFTDSAGSGDDSTTASCSASDCGYPDPVPGGDVYTAEHGSTCGQTGTPTGQEVAIVDTTVSQFGNRSTEMNPQLLLGTSIGPAGGYSGGTLGGFVRLPDGHVAALTCAHVLGLDSQGRAVSQPAQLHIQSDDALAQSVVGEVVKVVHYSGPGGIDAALVRIDDRCPVNGQFVSVGDSQLQAAGFNPSSPPKFNEGKVLKIKDITPSERHTRVIKFGSETGLSQGHIYLSGVYVRTRSRDVTTELFSQVEVVPGDGGSQRLFDLGDSGGLVFMPLDSTELHCIGMAVGQTSYGSCVITPIENVFEKLGLPAEFVDFTKQ